MRYTLVHEDMRLVVKRPDGTPIYRMDPFRDRLFAEELLANLNFVPDDEEDE